LVGEFGKELYQAERQRGKGVQPRMHRGLAYAAERALVNVVLRTISTALVIERVYKGDPIVYVDYTGYDAIAHHCGPERQEATDALEGIDRSIGSLQKAINDTPRPYRIVILSDHGQTLGFTFRQLYRQTLEEAVAGMAVAADSPGAPLKPDDAGLVVCCSGNLAMVYVDNHPGRASMETIERMHPGLLAALARHPGIGFVQVRSERRGLLVLSEERVEPLDGSSGAAALLAPYGATAREALLRLDSFANTGDIVLMGRFDPASGEVVSFEELVGSHGGLGGWQTEAFVLHPAGWSVDGPLIGAPSVYQLLRRWRSDLER
jgi:Type I phosphodiesterase / nucleotide pyrophosphatase